MNEYNQKVRSIFLLVGCSFIVFAIAWVAQAIVLGASALRIAMALEQGGVAAFVLITRARLK